MRGHSRRLLSVLLALVMLLSLLPAAVLAADATAKTFKKVKSGDELVTGQYVLVDEKGCSPKELSGNWVTKTTVAVNGDTATASEGIWTITVSADGVVLTDASNTSIAPSGGNNNGIKKGDYKWAVAFANGTFTFSGQGTDTVKLAGNTGADNKYRAYKNKTISGYADSYPCNFTLYKLDTVSARQSGIVTDLTTLQDGDTVVVFNPANGKTLSTEYNGFYNKGTDVTLTDGKLEGFTAADKWTLGVNADGTYTFATADGKKLAMGAKFTSTPLDEVNQSWKITPAATKDCFYIQNTVRNNYIEWYADKGNWSSYYNIGNNEALFAQQLYLVIDSDQPSAGLPKPGDQVVIYNQNAQAVLAAQNDNATSPAINKAAATIKDGKAACANGAAVFTVEKSGDYYRFYNKTYGYLCAGGTGNNAFYSATASDDADWLLRTCSGGVGGYEMEHRTAKFSGKYSQWLEYYSDSFKVYSMYNVTDYTIYSFSFYPVGPGTISDGVVNNPAVILGDLPDAYVGTDYSFPFTVDAPFGVRGDITAKLNGTSLSVTKGEDGTYTVTIPAASVTGDKLTVNIKGADNKYIPISAAAEITVKDEPVLADPTPARGSQTGENKRPTISVALDNAGQNPTVTMTVGGKTVTATYKNSRVTYTPAADLPQGRTEVTVTVRRADGKSASITWFFTVGATKYQHYFGQLHSHTQYSDGAGPLTDALRYVENLPASANVQFVAFTDHSNYFDSSSSPNVEAALYDTSLVKDSDANHSWKTYKDTIAKFNEDNAGSMVAIGGFEMTWSGGPGHINTFNTPGIVSRNNKTLNNKTDDAGMKAYYALLSQAEGATSISQFNHPGTTFGNFKDFNYWDPVIDSRMYMVEVGNGEGAIGAGGYYPSYEQYIMALDKGWHLAPTNNQDNHKGKWGNANDARDVILTDDFSEQGIYEAIRALRMYATEDKNLELTYTVNGLMMGSSITEIPDKLNVEVTVNDPDASDSIAKVEVVANSGKVAYTWDNAAQLRSGKLSATLDPSYSYYFIRVTQKDGDLAVTSPVWVGESLKLGISNMVCGTATPVTDEELTLTTTFFNSEDSDATIKSLTYSIGGTVIGTDKTGYTLAKSSTLDVPFKYTPTAARVFTVQVTAVVEQGNNEYTFTKTVGLDVLNADSLVYIGIDASHYNEYVSGNYKDSMGNFGNLAADHSVRTVQLNTGADLIAACSNPKYKALILTAPSRRLADAQKDPKTYSDAELKALAAFNAAGGTVILAGWSDNYENYEVIQKNPAIKHMAETQNDVLKALGSSLRISDDATYDDVRSAADGVDKWRLYFSTYNTDNFLTSGVIVDADHPYDKLYTERFSHYGGASIYAVDAGGNPTSALPATVSPVVYGHATTYSIDVDKDGKGGAGTPKYTYAENDNRLLVMATEQLAGKGLIVVSGAAFMSNFEVQAQLDNGAEKNYSNYRICENLVSYLNPVQLSTIDQIHQQPEEGFKYTVEGIVTSNASGHDKDTAFFDCIYIQDETGGINCFPVAGDFKIGDRVRVSGTTSSYQGERQLAVTKIEKIGDGTPVTPLTVTSTQVNDGSVLGRLVTLKGIVTAIEMAEGKVQTILVRDPQGKVARVFIDGYICPESEVQNLKVGCAIEATGLASYDNTFVLSDGTAMAPRIRISNRADVICTDHTHAFGAWTVTTPATCTASGAETRKCACGETETRLLPATGHTDANKDGKCDLCGQTLTPATGDTMHLTLWLSLMALTALAGVTLTRQKKRRT
ncbi:CehA/McbA family metallohydrolase [Vescimonas fastidiosa]|nr:CehA/McbA family metallohydrolase [Vescimonas fastidiosa]